MVTNAQKKNSAKTDRTPKEVTDWIRRLTRTSHKFITTTEPGPQKIVKGMVLQIITETTKGEDPDLQKTVSRVVMTDSQHALGGFSASEEKVIEDELNGKSKVAHPRNEIIEILKFKDNVVTVKTLGGETLLLPLTQKLSIYS